jgi:putative tryptophan/tyrosine transport system substrate-binding protein
VFRDQASTDYWAALQAAAPRFGLRLTGVEFRERPYDYQRALAEVAPADRHALIGAASPFFFQDRVILAELALRLRAPIFLNNRDSTIAGALMSYAPSLTGMFELAATYVDRIAKGTRPADLPVQQPVKFELVINGGTARALGIDIPTMVLAQADEVIE